jgi:C2H2 transcription facotor
MRDLSSLHATMAAANKATQQCGKHGAQQAPPVSVSLSADTNASRNAVATQCVHQQQHQHSASEGGTSVGAGQGVKQEDTQPTLSLVSQCPGTSTGYKGDTDHFHHHHPSTASRSWYVQDADSSHPCQVSSHSFRASVQSFCAPSASSTSSPTSATPTSPTSTQPGQSFLTSGESFVNLGVSDLPSWSTTTQPTTSDI